VHTDRGKQRLNNLAFSRLLLGCSVFVTLALQTPADVPNPASWSQKHKSTLRTRQGNFRETNTVEQKPALLLVDADMRTAMLCNDLAKKLGCNLLAADDQGSALATLDQKEIAVVLLGCDTIPHALDVLRHIKSKSDRTKILVVEKNPTVQSAVEAMKAGATDYLEKPLCPGALERSLTSAVESYRQHQAPIVPLEEMVRQAIRQAILRAEGDKMKAAQLLDIGKTTLYRKLREYGEFTQRHSRKQSPRHNQNSR
jgi:DNA-binding NtrC family response regulator